MRLVLHVVSFHVVSFHDVSFHEVSFHDDSPLFQEISLPFLEDSGCKCFVIKMKCGMSL